MKSLFRSNLSWFILLSLFGILLSYGMEQNKTKINTYSLKQIQNDFIGIRKNPQKYVEFQLNAEMTMYPDAGGLYELLPYYQKINPLGEKANHGIQWCDFTKQWKLIKVTPLGLFQSLDNELSTIATLLEDDEFSRPTNVDIKTYTTYETLRTYIKEVGQYNKELKMKIGEMENEITALHIENEKVKTVAKEKFISVRVKYEDLQNKLNKITKKNEELETITLEQKDIAEKNNIKEKEYQKVLKQVDILELDVEQKKIYIAEQKKSISNIEDKTNGLLYQLSIQQDYEKQIASLQKEIQKQKLETKKKDDKLRDIESKQKIQIKTLNEKLTKMENDIQFEMNAKDARIQNLTKAIEDGNEASKKEAKQYMQKMMNCYRETTRKPNLPGAKQYADLKEKHKKLQILLGMRESNIQAYETPKKKFKNDDF